MASGEESPVSGVVDSFKCHGLASCPDSSPFLVLLGICRMPIWGDIYREQLLRAGCGLPILYPKPAHTLKGAQSRRRIEVGDVGFVEDGRFVFLFNARTGLQKDDEAHYPGKFVALQVEEPVWETSVRPGGHVKYHATDTIGSSFNLGDPTGNIVDGTLKVSSTTESGAVLITPHATHSSSASPLARAAYEDYLKENADTWLKFARSKGCRALGRHELVLVTACDVTPQYEMVVWQNNKRSFDVKVNAPVASALGAGAEVTVEHVGDGSALHLRGPWPPVQGDDEHVVFIDGYSLSRVIHLPQSVGRSRRDRYGLKRLLLHHWDKLVGRSPKKMAVVASEDRYIEEHWSIDDLVHNQTDLGNLEKLVGYSPQRQSAKQIFAHAHPDVEFDIDRPIARIDMDTLTNQLKAHDILVSTASMLDRASPQTHTQLQDATNPIYTSRTLPSLLPDARSLLLTLAAIIAACTRAYRPRCMAGLLALRAAILLRAALGQLFDAGDGDDSDSASSRRYPVGWSEHTSRFQRFPTHSIATSSMSQLPVRDGPAEVLQELKRCLDVIALRANFWASLDAPKTVLRFQALADDVEHGDGLVDKCAVRLDIDMASQAELLDSDLDFQTARQKDERQLFYYFTQKRAQPHVLGRGNRDLALELTEAMRKTWASKSRDGDKLAAFSQNLLDILNKTDQLLSDPRLSDEEVKWEETNESRLSDAPWYPEGSSLYRGKWLRSIDVVVKVNNARQDVERRKTSEATPEWADFDEFNLKEASGPYTDAERLTREAATWKAVWEVDRGQHIVPYYGYNKLRDGRPYIVSQYMSEGNILSYLQEHPDTDRKKMILGIAKAIQVLHNMDPPVVHGDIRPSKVLIDKRNNEPVPLLGGFGLSKIIKTGDSNMTRNPALDVKRYMAPELLCVEDPPLDHSVDVYALGTTIYHIMTGSIPFYKIHLEDKLRDAKIKGTLERPSAADGVPMDDRLWDVVTECLRVDKAKRPSIDKVIKKLVTLSR